MLEKQITYNHFITEYVSYTDKTNHKKMNLDLGCVKLSNALTKPKTTPTTITNNPKPPTPPTTHATVFQTNPTTESP